MSDCQDRQYSTVGGEGRDSSQIPYLSGEVEAL